MTKIQVKMWSDHGPPSLVAGPISFVEAPPPLLIPTPSSSSTGSNGRYPRRGYYFPSRIALLVSVLLIVSGAASVVAGILAVVFSAAQSHWAAGVATGVVAGVAGALGMSAGRRREQLERGAGGVAWFMTAVVASVGAGGVLIYFAVIGWMEDRDAPPSFYFDEVSAMISQLYISSWMIICASHQKYHFLMIQWHSVQNFTPKIHLGIVRKRYTLNNK